MIKRKHRLVLECVILASELVRFGHELIALLNMALNYLKPPREPQMAISV